MSRPAPAPQRADKWISRAATATVAGLAGIAGAISYSHMRQLAAFHGDTGWHAHAFPLSVDGWRSWHPWSCWPTAAPAASRCAADIIGRSKHPAGSWPRASPVS